MQWQFQLGHLPGTPVAQSTPIPPSWPAPPPRIEGWQLGPIPAGSQAAALSGFSAIVSLKGALASSLKSNARAWVASSWIIWQTEGETGSIFPLLQGRSPRDWPRGRNDGFGRNCRNYGRW